MMGEYALTKAELYVESAGEYSFGKNQDKKNHFNLAEEICKEVISTYSGSRSAQLASNLLTEINQRSISPSSFADGKMK